MNTIEVAVNAGVIASIRPVLYASMTACSQRSILVVLTSNKETNEKDVKSYAFPSRMI